MSFASADLLISLSIPSSSPKKAIHADVRTASPSRTIIKHAKKMLARRQKRRPKRLPSPTWSEKTPMKTPRTMRWKSRRSQLLNALWTITSTVVLAIVSSSAEIRNVHARVVSPRKRENASTSMNANMETISAVTRATTQREAIDAPVPTGLSCRMTSRHAMTSTSA